MAYSEYHTAVKPILLFSSRKGALRMAIYRPKYKDPKTGELVESRVWCNEFEWNGNRIRESTRVRNERRVRQISKRKRLLSPASVNRELATLQRLLRLAKKRKVIASVPEEVKLLDGEHARELILSQQQEKRYLATVPEWSIISLSSCWKQARG
jgi:hypothetical protein